MRINRNKRLYILHQKAWWRNMNNIIVNYLHKGEERSTEYDNMITRIEALENLTWEDAMKEY